MNAPSAPTEITGMAGGSHGGADVRGMADDELLVHAAEVEHQGRLIDAQRVAIAAEIAERSRSQLGVESLATRKGCRNPVELLERVTRVSAATAGRRMRLGAAVRCHPTLCGFDLSARYPGVASALAAGELGVDAASAIVDGLNPALGHSSLDVFAAAEASLVAGAVGGTVGADDADDGAAENNVGEDSAAEASDSTGGALPLSADEVRVQAHVWRAWLDPDGVRPDEDRAMHARGLRLGAARGGIIPISGSLMPEVAGKLRRLFDAYLSPKTAPVAFLDAELAGESSESSTDDRTTDQKRHDILGAVLDTAARVAETPTIGGAAPTVLVTVREQDLAQRSGAGFIDGLAEPVSIESVEQFACTGGIQKVTVDENGAITALGSKERCFTPKQRRAIMARDGGCLIPGCSIPAGWTEIHHVIPDRHGGPTHTDNGVCLCWFHHRTIETSGWLIRMIEGAPQVKAPPWVSLAANWRPASKARTRIPAAA
jgi:hypothetical protein